MFKLRGQNVTAPMCGEPESWLAGLFQVTGCAVRAGEMDSNPFRCVVTYSLSQVQSTGEVATGTMAVTKTELLSDRARVHICCKTPWGVPDECTVVEILYESLRTLPKPPPMDHGPRIWGKSWEEAFYIPACNTTISFRFLTWQESDDCRMETLVGGPYLGQLREFARLTNGAQSSATNHPARRLISEHCVSTPT
jgi:hypothetical protein